MTLYCAILLISNNRDELNIIALIENNNTIRLIANASLSEELLKITK